MKTRAIALVIAAMLCPTLHPAPARGTICVLAQPAHIRQQAMTSPGFAYNPATLRFKIDKGDVISWPHEQNLKLEGLDTDQRHLIVIISDGKRIQSTWFRFSDFKTMDLCFSYDAYGGIQLSEVKHSVCKCK